MLTYYFCDLQKHQMMARFSSADFLSSYQNHLSMCVKKCKFLGHAQTCWIGIPQNSNGNVLCDNLEGWDGVGLGGKFKREGTYVYLWLIYLAVWQKPGEGNGTPLQYSCLENPMDRGAWWAAIYGVTQSRTWLKWLSSSMTETTTTL